MRSKAQVEDQIEKNRGNDAKFRFKAYQLLLYDRKKPCELGAIFSSALKRRECKASRLSSPVTPKYSMALPHDCGSLNGRSIGLFCFAHSVSPEHWQFDGWNVNEFKRIRSDFSDASP
jgi:hypothetical protein